MLKGITAKVKKHIGTVGYYAAKQGEEMAKVESFLKENGVDNVEINVALAGVKSGEIAADVAIEKINDVLGKAYDEVKKAEKAEAAKAAKAATAEAVAQTIGAQQAQ